MSFSERLNGGRFRFACMRIIFKICQIIAGTKVIRQFYEFIEFYYNKPFISFPQMSFSGRLNGGSSHGGQGHQTETGNGNNIVPLSICSHNLDGDDQNKLSLPFGIAHHMFSRILNLRIYKFFHSPFFLIKYCKLSFCQNKLVSLPFFVNFDVTNK